jgi:hypothetical protein
MSPTALLAKLAYSATILEMYPAKLALGYVVFTISQEQLQDIRETNNGAVVGLNVDITFRYEEKTFTIAQRKLSAVLSSIVRRSTNVFDAKFSFTKLTSDQRMYTSTLLKDLL